MTSVNNISPEEFERIESYLLGKMNPEERNEFENEMNSDGQLLKAVEEQRTLIQAIETGALGDKLDRIHEKTIGSSSDQTHRTNWFAIAAGVIILISVGIWGLNHQSPEEKLFAEYVTTDPGLPVPMSASSQYKFHDAMVDYKAEKYNKAIQKWSVQLEADPKSNVLNYYIGSAYFNLDQFEEALPYLTTASTQKTGDFRSKAQWYQVLSWLKLDKIDEILATVPLPDSPYRERIELIQHKLKA